MSRHINYVLIALAILVGSTFVWGQKNAANRQNSPTGVSTTSSTDGAGAARRRRRDAIPMAMTPSRKAAALAFVKQNHPELATLLRSLKKNKERAYLRALKQLYTTSERLARAKERYSPERFEVELEAWKLDSRIRLLAAQTSLSRKKDLKRQRELQRALHERIDIRVRLMRLDIDRLQKRVGKLAKTLDGVEADRDKAAAQYLKRIKRSLGIKARKKRSPKRKAAKRKSKQSSGSSKTNKKNE